jgi:hypothetical protein
MSDYIWDVPGEPQQKLTMSTCRWRGAFVVLKVDQTPVPDWAKNAVDSYRTHPDQWHTPDGSGKSNSSENEEALQSKQKTRKKLHAVQSCRLWLQAGPPKPDGARPDGSTCMQILDLVFSRQLFECPCVVGEFFVKFNEDDLGEDEEWSDLIQYQLRDMTNSEKQEIGISVDFPAVITQMTKCLSKSRTKRAQHVTRIVPGWTRNKLMLKVVPNGDAPGVFKYGSKQYTVPSGKAWTYICRLIESNAFDTHGEPMPSPSGMFRREHRAFFSERMTRNAAGWYIKTL